MAWPDPLKENPHFTKIHVRTGTGGIQLRSSLPASGERKPWLTWFIGSPFPRDAAAGRPVSFQISSLSCSPSDVLGLLPSKPSLLFCQKATLLTSPTSLRFFFFIYKLLNSAKFYIYRTAAKAAQSARVDCLPSARSCCCLMTRVSQQAHCCVTANRTPLLWFHSRFPKPGVHPGPHTAFSHHVVVSSGL